MLQRTSEGKRMEIKTVAIIGAGTMGRGIAYCSALADYQTILEDVSESTREQGLEYIRRAFDEGIARGKTTEEQKQQSLARIITASSVQDACRNADLIIEAVPEEMETKLEIFTILDKFAKPGAIFASNTSSLSITEMAAVTFRAENCIGMHFFNPVQKMKLLEIVRARGPPHGQGSGGGARIARIRHQPHQRDDWQRSVLHAAGGNRERW